MKITDPIAIVHRMEQLSPDVIKEQRMAELKDIAEWRARKMKAYRDWVDPAAITARKLEHAKNAAKALELGKILSAAAKAQIECKDRDDKCVPRFKLTPFYKQAPKRWPQRIAEWIKKTFGL